MTLDGRPSVNRSSVVPAVSGGWSTAIIEEGCEVPEALRRCEDFGDTILESLWLVVCVGDRVDLSKLMASALTATLFSTGEFVPILGPVFEFAPWPDCCCCLATAADIVVLI